MCNGTIALEIGIRALGLKGEVIIPSYTFIATAHALQWQGITPVFADIDRTTHNIDPAAVEKMITPRTSGIIGVHLWGRPAPVEDLKAISDAHGLHLMFDAAHAFGCSYRGETIGRFGRCEVLSFHATKVFNTMEGGALVTNDSELAETARLMRNFGFSGYDNVIHPGTNGKMPEVNAAMGLINLEALTGFIASNRRNYAHYARLFDGVPGIRLLEYDPDESSNYHYCVVQVDESSVRSRDDIVAALHAENILARKYFWPGCHRMGPYRNFNPDAGILLENTEHVAKNVIVLPNGTDLDEIDIETISSAIRVLVGQP
jgi:dTDP-4-amino-4,6-dideoxygalactose transaminase